MPGRKIPIITNQYYHVFNRGINHQETFSDWYDYHRGVQALEFYHFLHPNTKLSRFLQFPNDKKNQFYPIKKSDKLVDILCYCLMPNHFHLLLKQNIDNGISKFVGDFQNSYTRYYNSKRDRDGGLFLDQFKAVLITTDEELLHVSRYIHLNPATSYIIKDTSNLLGYKWSSLPDYNQRDKSWVSTEAILSKFKGSDSYLDFIYDQVGYQRQLADIYHHCKIE